jgi:hypothetical protein
MAVHNGALCAGPTGGPMDADVAVTAAVTLSPATIMGPLQSREGKFVPLLSPVARRGSRWSGPPLAERRVAAQVTAMDAPFWQ